MKIEGNPQDMFNRIDMNRDGKISKDEFKSMAPKPGGSPTAGAGMSLDDIFSQIDTDGDGAISQTENEAFLKTQETRHRGALDPAKVAQSLFRKGDTDGDGKMTKAELLAVLPQRGDSSELDRLFSEADADGDGSISEKELQASLEKHLQHVQGYDAAGEATTSGVSQSRQSFKA